MRRRGKGEGRVCIVEVTTGHVSYVSRAFCQADWSSGHIWIRSIQWVNSQTVQLVWLFSFPSVDCRVDRCVGMVDLFTCCRQPPSCASDVSQWILLQAVLCVCVCVWCLHIEFQGPLNYPCHRNPFNSSDLNFTCMTALIGYWKQHTDLISLSSLWPSQLSPRCALICFLGGGDCATISFHK